MLLELFGVFEVAGQTVLKILPITIVLGVVFAVLTHWSACNPGSPWWRKREIITDVTYWIMIPVGARFILALLVEGAWEIFENTEFTINRYRSVTISLDYFGDSVVNSISDIVAMMAGFGFAAAAPVWAAVALGVVFELVPLWMIRDNLTLNVLMFLHPVEWIKRWQSGG